MDQGFDGLLGIGRSIVANTVRLFHPEEIKASQRQAGTRLGPCLLVVPSRDFRAFFVTLCNAFSPELRMENAGAASEIFETIFTGFCQGQRMDALQEAELLYRLLFELRREQRMNSSLEDSIDFALRYLRENFRRPINSKTIAAKCGISPEHLIRAFSRRHGESPSAMLSRLRIENARAMLLVPDSDIKQIAATCGFTSVKCLARVYRRKFGLDIREAQGECFQMSSR